MYDRSSYNEGLIFYGLDPPYHSLRGGRCVVTGDLSEKNVVQMALFGFQGDSAPHFRTSYRRVETIQRPFSALHGRPWAGAAQ